MKRLQPVIWSKGTFLSPQHLQIQDRFLETSLQFQLQALTFQPWGFTSLHIHQDLLSTGTFSTASAAGILPDGLAFDIPASDPAPPPKQIAEEFDGDQTAIEIYLAIPDHRERGLNISMAQRNVDTRYLAEIAMLRDENSGQNEKPVQLARKNFRLLVGEPAQQGVASLRIGRVVRTPAGIFQLDSKFVPPILNIGASDYLTSIARRLVEILATKSSQLAGSRRQKNLSLADFGTADIASFWLLYTINSHFPVLRHIFEIHQGHPEHLYNVLLELAGGLTTFSSQVHPRDLPRYDHDRPSACFTQLDETLRMLLETVVPSNFVSLPLKLVQPSIYAVSIDNDKYLRNTRVYLAITAETGEADIIAKAPYLVKVCSVSQIDHLVQRALPGVTLTHVQRLPSSIPVKLNYQYFSLNQSGTSWEAIERSRNLAAYVPGELPAPQMELVILLPEAE